MISLLFGQQIKALHEADNLSQIALCERARVSRAVLSKMENGIGPVQTDVLDRLVVALGAQVTVTIGESVTDASRVEARLRQRLREAALREFHLRLAVRLSLVPEGAGSMIKRAKQQVALWAERKTCSADYVDRWNAALSGTPQDVAAAMSALGEWENAMFQNSPWMFLQA